MSEPSTPVSIVVDDTSTDEISISLGTNSWYYNPYCPLGPAGGFGEVFLGRSSNDQQVAVKKIKFSAANKAARELKMAEYLVTGEYQNIIPVLDYGLDSNTGTHFIIMPKAHRSLQDAINDGMQNVDTTIDIMRQIANGLSEVPKIVHRDLKPGNVLQHLDKWKIADFGLAKFVEAATAADTMKDYLSAYYAAPEQWRIERTCSRTDVYALGCIGYALLTGTPPFVSESKEQLKYHHLNSDPPSLPDHVPNNLKLLLTSMLRKPSESRPILPRVLAILDQIANKAAENFGVNVLAKAAADEERLQAARDTQAFTIELQKQERENIAVAGRAIYSSLTQELKKAVLEAAPNVVCCNKGEVVLGAAVLHIPPQTSSMFEPKLFRESGWDVILGEAIGVVRHQTSSSDEGYIISSSLWYAKLPDTDQFRWYEVNYWGDFRNRKYKPYELMDHVYDADKAASNIMHTHKLCWGPYPVDDDNSDEFIERWLALFGKAIEGSLAAPRNVPLGRFYWKNGDF